MDNLALDWGLWCHERPTLDALEAALGHAETASIGTPAVPGGTVRRNSGHAAGNVITLPGAPAAVFTRTPRHRPLIDNILAGLPQRNWSEKLLPADIDEMLKAIAAHPAMKSLADAGRDEWRNLVWSFKAFEHLGASVAYEAALRWSQTSKKYGDGSDFHTVWRDGDPNQQGCRIGPGTLLKAAHHVGVDLTKWKVLADAERASATTTLMNGAVPYKTGEMIPVVMSKNEALGWMNGRYAYIHKWGGNDGEPLVAELQPDRTYIAVPEEHLKKQLRNRRVRMKRDGKTERVELVPWWLKHQARREYNRALCDPAGRRMRANDLNLYVGFDITPKPVPWFKLRRIMRHLFHVVCDYSRTNPPEKRAEARAAFKFLIRWLAHCVQYPGVPPESVIVLRSDAEGSGKSTVAELMARIFGKFRHAIVLNDPDELTGVFNDHLERCVFIALDEPAFPGDHKAAAKFKSMVTGSTWLINGKFRKAYPAPNIAHIMLTTNGSWAVPAGNKARRFLVLDVNDKYAGQQGRPYFEALYQDIENGGLEGLLHMLLQVKVTHADVRYPPRTLALRRQQLLSAPSYTQWLMDAAEMEAIVVPDGYGQMAQVRLPAQLTNHELSEAYGAFCNEMKLRRVSNIELGRRLRGYGFNRTVINGTPHYDIPDVTSVAVAARRAAGIV